MAKEKRNAGSSPVEIKNWQRAPGPARPSEPKLRVQPVETRRAASSGAQIPLWRVKPELVRPEQGPQPAHTAPRPELEGTFEVRPIGTSIGLRELAALHKRTWDQLGVIEKKVHMILWPLALHLASTG